MKKLIDIAKRIIFILSVGMLSFTACQESLEERCARECKEYTKKKCPVLIAKDIYLDSLTFNTSNQMLSYYYTVEGVLDDAEFLKQRDFRGMLLKELKQLFLCHHDISALADKHLFCGVEQKQFPSLVCIQEQIGRIFVHINGPVKASLIKDGLAG